MRAPAGHDFPRAAGGVTRDSVASALQGAFPINVDVVRHEAL